MARWTEEEVEILTNKYNEGWMDVEIAELLPGRTKLTVRSKRKSLGLSCESLPHMLAFDRRYHAGEVGKIFK